MKSNQSTSWTYLNIKAISIIQILFSWAFLILFEPRYLSCQTDNLMPYRLCNRRQVLHNHQKFSSLNLLMLVLGISQLLGMELEELASWIKGLELALKLDCCTILLFALSALIFFCSCCLIQIIALVLIILHLYKFSTH